MSEVEAEVDVNVQTPADEPTRAPSDDAYIQAQIQIGLQRYLAQLTPDKVEETITPVAVPTPITPISGFTSLSPSAHVSSAHLTRSQLLSDSDKALAARLKGRRELTAIPYKDLYSSDRRKANKQVPENASFSDARGSLMGSATAATSLAVGLDTRELCMMASLRAPGINGLI